MLFTSFFVLYDSTQISYRQLTVKKTELMLENLLKNNKSNYTQLKVKPIR
jgi:hypothetical protein